MTALNFLLTRALRAHAARRRRDRRDDARPRREHRSVARARARSRHRRSRRRSDRRARGRLRRSRSGSSRTARASSDSRSRRTRSARPPTSRRSCELAHDAGALAWADAVHYAPHGPIDVAAWDVDVLICSPYKFFGPHLGRRLREARAARVVARRTRCGPPPNEPVGHRFELGTLPHELLAGFVAAVDYVDSLGWDAIRSHERRSANASSPGSRTASSCTACRRMSGRVPTFCFNVPGARAESVADRPRRARPRGLARQLLRARDDGVPRARGRRRPRRDRPLQHRGRGRPPARRARRARVKLLLLGGPRFLGRAIADAALERGHELTFFNRGTTNPELYPEVDKLRGDRAGDLGASGGSRLGRRDRHLRVPPVASCAARPRRSSGSGVLLLRVQHLRLRRLQHVRRRGRAARRSLATTRRTRSPTRATAPLKALCEEAVRDVFGGRALVVRPGLIVGPHDPTGRFTYWPHRIARGGEVLAPAPSDGPTQIIDVRDLASWLVSLCEDAVGGTYNATHPGVSWTELLDTCRVVTGSDARITWVTPEFLARARSRSMDGAATLARRSGRRVR